MAGSRNSCAQRRQEIEDADHDRAAALLVMSTGGTTMRHRRWIARLALMAVMGVAGTAAGTAPAAPRVQGDAAAFEEIVAAFRKLYLRYPDIG